MSKDLSSRSSHGRLGNSKTSSKRDFHLSPKKDRRRSSDEPETRGRSSQGRYDSAESSSRPSYKRSSSERISRGSSRRGEFSRSGSERLSGGSSHRKRGKSSRHRRSRIKPRRTKSSDSLLDMGPMDVLSEDEEHLWSGSEEDSFAGEDAEQKPRRSDEKSGRPPFSPSRSMSTVGTLYGKDADAKAEAKAARGVVEPASTPGVKHISRNGTAINALYGKDTSTDAKAKMKAKASVGSSERATNPGVEQIFSSPTLPFSDENSLAVSTLYGKDADAKAKAKAKASRGSSEAASVPGVEQILNPSIRSMNGGVTVSALYGNDTDAKVKAFSGKAAAASLPGVDRVFSPTSASIWKKAKATRKSWEAEQMMLSPISHTMHTVSSSTINTLYGGDAEAKAKTSRGGNANFASNPGVETVLVNSSTHTAMSTLYGSEAESKAKARAGRGGFDFASNPGVESMHHHAPGGASVADTAVSTTDTLYGDDADAKAKARVGRGTAAFAANPGVESVAHRLSMNSLSESTRSSNHLDAQAKQDVEEPVARRVSISSIDSESESTSQPERKAAGRGSAISEAMQNVQMPNDPEAGSKRQLHAEKKKREEKPKKSRKKRLVLFFFLFLLGGGGAAVWYFLLKNDGSEENQTGSAGIQGPTTAPSFLGGATTLGPFTPLTTGSPSFSPSAPPSEELLYDPPSETDCDAISKGQPIAGRDDLENTAFGLDLEVALQGGTMMTDSLLEALLGAIRAKIVPSLVGCNIDLVELERLWRFVILDAVVRGSLQPEETCEDDALSEQNCHRVYVQLGLYLKGTASFLDI
ncbi:MAG: hypothetical protein SGBAC_005583, partial [Bacillariaceae sp.]